MLFIIITIIDEIPAQKPIGNFLFGNYTRELKKAEIAVKICIKSTFACSMASCILAFSFFGRLVGAEFCALATTVAIAHNPTARITLRSILLIV